MCFSNFGLHLLAHQRVQDGFELLQLRAVGEDQRAQGWAVELATASKTWSPQRARMAGNASAVARGERSGDFVGVDDVGAELGKKITHGGFAAGDAAGETDREFFYCADSVGGLCKKALFAPSVVRKAHLLFNKLRFAA